MLLSLDDKIGEADFILMETTEDHVIDIDLSGVKYLTSKELSRLLILKKKRGRVINLLRANDRIRETIDLLSFKDVFIVKT